MSRILVTGASRGIGAAITRHLATQGHCVYAGMRHPDTADTALLGAGDVHLVRLDVTRDADIRNVIQRMQEDAGGIDVLINNAGVAWFAPAEEMSADVLRTTMETNFFGAVACTQAVLPVMRSQGSGRIIMISTIAAALGLPLESAYCASKRALEAYSESLRLEVARFGIHVSAIEPGITEGGLSTSIPDPQAPAHSVYAPLLDHTHAFYAAAQDEVESPALITNAIDAILQAPTPAFRHRLGRFAPLADAVLAAPQAQADQMLAEALAVEWWLRGAAQPAAA